MSNRRLLSKLPRGLATNVNPEKDECKHAALSANDMNVPKLNPYAQLKADLEITAVLKAKQRSDSLLWHRLLVQSTKPVPDGYINASHDTTNTSSNRNQNNVEQADDKDKPSEIHNPCDENQDDQTLNRPTAEHQQYEVEENGGGIPSDYKDPITNVCDM